MPSQRASSWSRPEPDDRGRRRGWRSRDNDRALVKQGLLPTPQIINMGRRRGRTIRWPMHAPEQAAWVRARLDEGWTFPEVLEALARGELKPSTAPAAG